MKTKAINEMTLEFPSRSSNEGLARSVAACFAAQMDPTVEELGDIRTAIVHGYPDSIGKVQIKLRIYEGNVLELVIKDHGRGIPDVNKAREPMFTTGGEERSGMGFTIMESFMDKLSVRSVPGRGTSVTMKKKLAPRVKSVR